MKYIDLHTHSNASDGTLTPSEVVSRAAARGLSAIALTDHDTIDGIPEAASEATKHAIRLIPGTELSCYYQVPYTEHEQALIASGEAVKQREVEIHILGLFVDYQDAAFLQALNDLKQARYQRNLKMISLFEQDGIPMSMEALTHGNPNSVVTRAHFARVLIEEGIVKNKEQAFKHYLGPGCKYYLPKPEVTPEYVLSLIRQAGGIAILAHPLIYKLGYAQVETLIQSLIPLGLSGIEAYHSSNNTYESDRLRSMTLKYNLVVSGGSDFHGANKPDIELGIGRGGLRITEHILNQIEARRNALQLSIHQ